MDNLATKCVSDLQTSACNKAHKDKEVSLPVWHMIASEIWNEVEDTIGDDIKTEVWWELRDG